MSVNENTKRENDGSSSEAKRSKRPEKVHRVTYVGIEYPFFPTNI